MSKVILENTTITLGPALDKLKVQLERQMSYKEFTKVIYNNIKEISLQDFKGTQQDTILLTDSICKKATSTYLIQKIHHLPLPGKDIHYVTKKTLQDDAYNLQFYKNIILHLGTINILNHFNNRHPTTPQQLKKEYQDLITIIKNSNKNVNIILSTIIPIPRHKDISKKCVHHFNALIYELAVENTRTVIINTHRNFVDKTGRVKTESYYDKLHPIEEESKTLIKLFGQARCMKTFMQKRHKMAIENCILPTQE